MARRSQRRQRADRQSAQLAASKRARIVRSAAEFDVAALQRLAAAIRTPQSSNGAHGWLLSEIRSARDDQMVGRFERPTQLAAAMRTDDAVYTAWRNRLAPARNLPRRVVPAASARGAAIGTEAAALFGQGGPALTTETIVSILGELVDHGLAIAYVEPLPRDDGSRVDVRIHHWPLRFVRWDSLMRTLVTRVESVPGEQPPPVAIPTYGGGTYQTTATTGVELPITHGDGRWIVFRLHAHEPWRAEACILPAALVWARHAFAARDWSKGSTSHGNTRVVGEMPAGVALADGAGTLTSEAGAFMSLLAALYSGDSPVGIRPAGSKTDVVTNTSSAWQVWAELCLNAEKAAARIYLGTDGILGAQGGAPGVDITALFGVASTLVAGDLGCLAQGITTGAMQPWCAWNFGDSRLAGALEYEIPDADADAVLASDKARDEAFHAEIKRMRDNGFVLTQPDVDRLAERYGVEPPQLPEQTTKAPSVTLAPSDLVPVVRVDEARASAGLGPLLLADGSPDPDGRLMVEEYKAKVAAARPALLPAGAAP